MQKKYSQSGFSHLILALGAVVVLAVAGFAFYRAYNANQGKTKDQTSSASTVPETIQSTDDLDQAQSAVEGTNVDSDLDTSQLEQDANSLL